MVVEQRNFGMDEKGSSFCTNDMKNFPDRFITFKEIRAINTTALHPMKSFDIFISILGTCFCCIRGNVPSVILYQVEDGELFQCCHLKSFGHFPFCYGSISQGTNDQGFFIY